MSTDRKEIRRQLGPLPSGGIDRREMTFTVTHTKHYPEWDWVVMSLMAWPKVEGTNNDS